MHRLRCPRLGLFSALLALAAQLAFGAAVPQPVSGLAQSGVICHVDPDQGRAPVPPGHRAPGCALCPLCLSLAAPAPVLAAAPAAPMPSANFVARPRPVPPATGPPPLPSAAAQPRGPPALA